LSSDDGRAFTLSFDFPPLNRTVAAGLSATFLSLDSVSFMDDFEYGSVAFSFILLLVFGTSLPLVLVLSSKGIRRDVIQEYKTFSLTTAAETIAHW